MLQTPIQSDIALEPCEFTLLDRAYAIRGEYLDHCAKVEDWICKALRHADGMGIKIKQPYLFGQKLKAAIDLAQQTPNPFRKPEAVLKRLKEFQSYADMRGWLGHAIITVAQSEQGEELIIFIKPGSNDAIPGHEAKCISFIHAKTINSSLKGLAKLICDQNIKAIKA
ncbi:hypothetical protein [Sphingorhabdus sp. Alg239-R122]|uniref:hypothetical protein n=1 Tax=Sphingorhabdus sp. Alg239-R122 TaxID=2305989 RepID=UPI0013DADEFA|nr:hypothetical protein [Sphingorhabdus sp. Alg239-R122]